MSATNVNVAHAGKRGNICVDNNVSSFARAFTKFKIKIPPFPGLALSRS